MTEQELYIEALDHRDLDDRRRFLDEACADNHPLRARLDVLIRHAEELGSFLEQPSPDFAPTITERHVTEAPGTVIGPYKLLEQIGEGGFGIVFLAEQTAPVRRKVALKVLKPGMDTRQVVARFEAERQALAIMDDPHIAKVHDGGATPSGRPYFVMELVKGVPITDFCDQNHLTPRQRLELFIPVCQAVQHAHQKGIIHRDLKPSNVLVSRHDTTPVVKIIDFGVAKAVGQALTDRTLFTGMAQMIGTPLYMSPEQAGMSDLDVDTRSDIYSLGVLLYELLTGTTPLDKERFKSAGYDEIRRIIREEEPTSPSTKLSTAEGLPSLAANRGTEPAKLTRLVRGELDWIVLKALDKDRNRRYETASAFAADVQRYLDDEPVQACPPSNWYRFRKLALRNRALFLTASVVAVALLTAGVLVWRAKDDLAQNLAREQRETYFQRITGAYRELSSDRLGPALDLLNACPKDLRGWEWHYLMRLCRVQPLVISDDTEINGLAFSPDGERIASACGNGMIRIWNSRTGDRDPIQSFSAHTNSVVSVAFHPDGKHLASRGADKTVKVWNLTTEKELFTEPCDAVRKYGTAYTMAFSADGRLLAAGTDGLVKVWDWKNHQLLHSLPGHILNPCPVAFSGDGRLAIGIFRESLKLWDVETETLLRPFPEHTGMISALAFSPDGKWLASASYDRTVKLSDSTTGAMLPPFEGHTGNVECVAFSTDGKLVASGGEDKVVRVWEAKTGRELLTLHGHTGRCCCVAFSPDPSGLRLASASIDGTIRFWDATPLRGDERQEILNFDKHTGEIRCVAFSPVDSQKVASAGNDGLVKVWDAQAGDISAEFSGHEKISGIRPAIFCMAWHPRGHRIASSSADTVRAWDMDREWEALRLPAGPKKIVLPYPSVAFSLDGRYLVTGHTNGAVEVWDAETGDPIGTLGTHTREVRGLVFSRDGRYLASSSDGAVKLWDAKRLEETPLEEKQELHEFPARVPGPSVNVAFSPDGRRLATASEKNMVIIWDMETRVEVQKLWGAHSGEVYAVAFSPVVDSRLIATAGEDSAVKVWDSHTGTLIHSFRGHEGLVCCLAFSPNGERLVSGSRDKTVKVWDMTQLSD